MRFAQSNISVLQEYATAFCKLPSIYVFSYFPFGFEGRMWDPIVISVPDHCLSFYFSIVCLKLYFVSCVYRYYIQNHTQSSLFCENENLVRFRV